MLNGRKTIGIMIFDITAFYQIELSSYLSRYMKEKGYNFLVFSAFTIYGRGNNNAAGENNIMHLIPFEQLDAFILCHDTFESDTIVTDVKKLLDERCHCPIISIRTKVDGYYNILADDKDAIPSLIRHLHEVHNYDRIAFMSGPLSHPDAVFRLQIYHKTMEQLQLPHPDEYVFEGDFWKSMGEPAAHHFTSLPNPPQAIVCANDYMALSLCKSLILQGYNIPQDFAICGFDDVADAGNNFPPLTTCKVRIDELAFLAVDTIHQLLQGKEVDKNRYTNVVPVIRNSCGCETVSMHDMSVCQMKEVDLSEQLLNQSVHNTFTSIALENLVCTEDIGDYLAIEDYPDNARDFYLCLGKKGEGSFPQTRQEKPGFAEQSQSIYSLKDLTPIITSSFVTKDLLPPEAIREEPMSIYFFPIHYLQYNFGYVAATSSGKKHTNSLFHSWLAIVGNTLENARIRAKNEALLDKLNTLYLQDSLTKLYNRRGFEQYSATELAHSQKCNVSSMILGIDMDNLKYINDEYGHAQGDTALCTIAKAIQSACTGEEICARIGGDEYEVFGFGYTAEQADGFVQRFQQYLHDFNASSELPYQVNASTGFTISEPNSDNTLEYYITISDNLLYENKRERKKRFGNLSLRPDANN